MILKIKRLYAEDLPLPKYHSDGAAGIDLHCAIDVAVLQVGEISKIPTGVAVEIPNGYEGQVRGRSGLAFNYHVFCTHVGTIDSDYRGELFVMLRNLGKTDYTIRRGDRIGQLVISAATQAMIEEVGELSKTDRNTNGFGSTGRS